MSPLPGEEEDGAEQKDAGAEHLAHRQRESEICLKTFISKCLGYTDQVYVMDHRPH